MEFYSKDEAVCIQEAYREQGIFSVLRETDDGFVCEVPDTLKTFDGVNVAESDTLFFHEEPNTPVSVDSIEPNEDFTSYRVTVSTASYTKDIVIEDFHRFNTCPWSKEDLGKLANGYVNSTEDQNVSKASLVKTSIFLVVVLCVSWYDLKFSSDSFMPADAAYLLESYWKLLRYVITPIVIVGFVNIFKMARAKKA